VKGSFAAPGRVPRRLVLVDDVYTSLQSRRSAVLPFEFEVELLAA
jgi:hypothetical protein